MICDELLKLRGNERLDIHACGEWLIVRLLRDDTVQTEGIPLADLTPGLLSESLEMLRRRHNEIDTTDKNTRDTAVLNRLAEYDEDCD